MTIEKWALPIFKNAGFTPASIEPAARAEIEYACCEVCDYPGGKESLNSEPPYLYMYLCDVCHRTYSWKCMRALGCYTNGQRQDIDNNNYWACPACAHLENQTLTAKNSCALLGSQAGSQKHAIIVIGTLFKTKSTLSWMPSFNTKLTNLRSHLFSSAHPSSPSRLRGL
eukprot:1142145-Pelagomonas_calceolata.AAC.2